MQDDTTNNAHQPNNKPLQIGLFVTCMVDLFRPSVGFSAIKLLEDSGCEVHVPRSQTCCGQVAYNAGDRADTRDIACLVIEAFEKFDYVVAPSGSCAAMIKKHYPELFSGDEKWEERAQQLAAKTYELVSFLTDVIKRPAITAKTDKKFTYHDSCSGLRELGIESQPRQLLSHVEGAKLVEMEDSDTCCGFGGLFCVKYSDISDAIVTKKIDSITSTNADVLLAGDMGCLMNMAGKLKREGSTIEVRHIAEVLSGITDAPPIAGGGK